MRVRSRAFLVHACGVRTSMQSHILSIFTIRDIVLGVTIGEIILPVIDMMVMTWT